MQALFDSLSHLSMETAVVYTKVCKISNFRLVCRVASLFCEVPQRRLLKRNKCCPTEESHKNIPSQTKKCPTPRGPPSTRRHAQKSPVRTIKGPGSVELVCICPKQFFRHATDWIWKRREQIYGNDFLFRSMTYSICLKIYVISLVQDLFRLFGSKFPPQP